MQPEEKSADCRCKLKTYSSLILSALLLAIAYQPCLAATSSNSIPLKNQYINPCREMQYDQLEGKSAPLPQSIQVVPGDYLKAATIASNSFQRFISRHSKHKKGQLAIFLSDIKNYCVSIDFLPTDNIYVVRFTPDMYLNKVIRGGVATFYINGKSFKILHVEHSM
jgi:hypothetical protein